MAKITVTICDECEGQEDVTRYEVKVGTKRATVDLCKEHKEPMERFLMVAPRPTARKTTTKSPAAKKATSRGRRVTSLEEIEELKR